MVCQSSFPSCSGAPVLTYRLKLVERLRGCSHNTLDCALYHGHPGPVVIPASPMSMRSFIWSFHLEDTLCSRCDHCRDKAKYHSIMTPSLTHSLTHSLIHLAFRLFDLVGISHLLDVVGGYCSIVASQIQLLQREILKMMHWIWGTDWEQTSQENLCSCTNC